MKSKTQFDHNIQTSSRGSESRQPVGGKKKNQSGQQASRFKEAKS